MSILRYLGFAEELTYNTDSTPDVKKHVDISSATLDTPSDPTLIFEGGMGRTNSIHRPGFYSPSGNIVYATDVETMIYFLKWALGGYKFAEGNTVIEEDTVSAVVDNGTYKFETTGSFDPVPEEGDRIVVSGFSNDENNGNFKVVSATTTEIVVEQEVKAEDAGETITIKETNVHEAYGIEDNILPSFTSFLGKDHFEHVFMGCVVNSLELTIEGEFAQMTVDVISAKDKKETIKAIADLSLPGAYPIVFHEVCASLAGSNISADVKSMTISIENNMDAEAGRGLCSRNPNRIIAGNRNVTVSKNLFYENTEHLERFWGGSDGPSDDGTEEFDMEITFNAGKFGEAKMKLPRLIYTNIDSQPTGRDELVQSTTATAFLGEVTELDVETDIYVEVENAEGEVGNND